MKYQTNGYQVPTILKVGNSQYDICNPFQIDGQAWSKLTDDEYRMLPENERLQRVNALYRYVKKELGLTHSPEVNLNPLHPARKQDTTSCTPGEQLTYYHVEAIGVNGMVNKEQRWMQGFFENEQCTLYAASDSSDMVFNGWFENDVLVDGAGEFYSFNVAKNRYLEARYSANHYITIDGLTYKEANFEGIVPTEGQRFTINASSSWAISASEGWILLDRTEGDSGVTVVTVNVSNNSGSYGREGVVKIELKNGEASSTLAVKQSEAIPLVVSIDVVGKEGGGKPIITCCVSPILAPMDITVTGKIELIRESGGQITPFAGPEWHDFKLTIPQGGSCVEEKIEDYYENFSYRIDYVSVDPPEYNGMPIRII